MYFSHYSFIKFVGFELIYYVINLCVVSSSMVFSEFICVSIEFESKNYFLFKKKNLVEKLTSFLVQF